MAHFPQRSIFSETPLIFNFTYLLVPFFVKNFKKILEQIQRYDDASYLVSKWPICSKPPVPSGKFFRAATTAQKIFPDEPLAAFKRILRVDPE